MSNIKKATIQPLIISKQNKRLLQRQNLNLQLSNLSVYTEEVIYNNDSCDFLKGESQAVSIVNKLNLVNKTCRTIAKCTSKGVTVETTSDDICSLIGQKNYDTVLTALSSIFNAETKVRGILALLKPQTVRNSVSTQADIKRTDLIDNSCQTNESRLSLVPQKRKRLRRSQFSTYVVKESLPPIRKCIININDMIKKEDGDLKEETKPENDVKGVETMLPNLDHDPELSNLSCGSIGSISSFPSIPDLLDRTDELLVSVERSTEKDVVEDTVIKVLDGSTIRVPIKPPDHFHVATPEILKHVTKEERMKLVQYQAYIDSKVCLQQNKDGYYPLHVAVVNDEVGVVRRQCFALRRRGESVDILAGGMTALHMAIQNNASAACITGLLHFGADVLLRDSEGRSGLHHAADAEIETLNAVLGYCDKHASRVLRNNKEFWKPDMERTSEAGLAKYLYEKAAVIFDDQGYTPLMLAASLAREYHVAALAIRAPSLVDVAARSSGETALYRAVAAACLHARNSNNHSLIPDRFLKTVEILVDNGADPSIENHSGSSVNSLLTEYNISSLSMAIANKMNTTHKQLANSMMLYKEKDGNVVWKNLRSPASLLNVNNVAVAEANKAKDDILWENLKKKTGSVVKLKNDNLNKLGNLNVINPEPKKIVKKFTIVAPQYIKDINTNEVRLEMRKTTQNLVLKDNLKIKRDKDKVIIVENVKLNTDNIPKARIVKVKPKNIITTNPAERIMTVNNRRKLKISQKLMQSDIEKVAKKMKLNEK